MSAARDRLLGKGSSGSGMGEFIELVKKPGEVPGKAENGRGIDLDKGKRKAFIEFVTKAGRSVSIPYHFIDDIESAVPDYRKIVVTFVKRDLVTVTLHAFEGGNLEAMHKRIKAQLIGKICEKDPLKEKREGAALDPDGDEFSVVKMSIDVKKN